MRLLPHSSAIGCPGFQPDTDLIENLSTAVVIDQKRLGGNSRSTVGTITDIYAMLRLLFSRIGKLFASSSHFFSFNKPAGMCRNALESDRWCSLMWTSCSTGPSR
jgi:excinuclease UvrABC ATPase subunit